MHHPVLQFEDGTDARKELAANLTIQSVFPTYQFLLLVDGSLRPSASQPDKLSFDLSQIKTTVVPAAAAASRDRDTIQNIVKSNDSLNPTFGASCHSYLASYLANQIDDIFLSA